MENKEKEEEKSTTQERLESVPGDALIGGRIICPKCGFDTREAMPKVKDEDKQEYIRAVLGDRLFSKEYPLFGGQLKVEFRDLSVAETTHLMTMVEQLPKDITFMSNTVGLKMLYSCVRLEKGGKLTELPPAPVGLKTVDEVMSAYNKMFGGMGETVQAGLINAYNTFNQLLLTLGRIALDTDF
jgi:hypothetical protein